MRVAIVGAGRTVNGTGPFLGRFAAEAGAEIVAATTTRAETLEPFQREMAQSFGQAVSGYTDLESMLAAHPLDALIIASPAAAHEEALDAALAYKLHVLCEKPLVWGGHDPAARAAELQMDFLDADRWLRVQTQWPLTLDTFHELHPQAPTCPQRFEMGMAPPASGVEMLVESVSHPLSLLATFAPDPEATLEDVRVRRIRENWELRFVYVASGTAIEVRFDALHAVRQPRPAWYVLDGRRVDRIVELEPYQMWLDAGGRMVPLPDPTRLLVRSFVEDVREGREPEPDPAVVPGVALLAQLVEAARNAT